MDNQQNQTGPMPGDDVRTPNAGNTTGSSGLGNNATGAGAGRKTGASGQGRGGAQGSADASTNDHGHQQPTATSGQDRQGEGQQTNGEEGNLLDTALQSGKKWIEDSGVLNGVNDLPKNVKDWGTRAVSRVGDLTTTQKIVGGALLAVGIGYLATRKGKSSKGDSGTSRSDYGRQSSGSYGRRNYGYQAPDASTGRSSASGASGHSDSGSAYGNSGSRYGSSGASSQSGSGQAESGFGTKSSSSGDQGSRTSEGSYRKNEDFRSIE